MRGWRGSLWIAGLAMLCSVLTTVPATPAEAQSGGQRQGTSAAQKGAARAPGLKANAAGTPEQVAPAARSAEEAAHEAQEREERAALERQLAEAAAALGTHGLGLTYATIGLIVVTASLWLVTFLQARDLRAAVRAIEASSAAAQSSAQFMQRALMLTQRATVIVGEPQAVWLRDGAERLVGCRLLVTWHNVGATPTRDMLAAVAGLISEKPPSRTSALPRADDRQQPMIVGPNAVINSAHVNLPIGLVTDILEHRAYYLFAGWAEYNDAFQYTARHRVEFCYWLEFDGDLAAQRLEARFHIHGKHNRHYDTEDGIEASGTDTMAEAQKVKYGVEPASDPQGLVS